MLVSSPGSHAAVSDQLTVNPAQPTTNDSISILVKETWPQGSGPIVSQWSRSGSLIRIDAVGVLPGIPQPIVQFQLRVEVGQLPVGHYRVEYFLEVHAAPAPPPPVKGVPAPDASLELGVPGPDASLAFEVVAADVARIPALNNIGLALLILALLLVGSAKQLSPADRRSRVRS